MNIFTRFGNWMDERRVLRKPDYDALRSVIQIKDDFVLGEISKLRVTIMSISDETNRNIKGLKGREDIPATISKEFALINARLNRIELLVGLKREPAPAEVPGAARIS